MGDEDPLLKCGYGCDCGCFQEPLNTIWSSCFDRAQTSVQPEMTEVNGRLPYCDRKKLKL